MKATIKALLLNLLCFGVLFFFFRFGINALMPLPYIPLLLVAAVLASVIAPKFLVKQKQLFVKFPWKKQPKKW